MNCEQYQEYISQFIDGELPPTAEIELFEHLVMCEQCRTFLKNILSLRNTLVFTQQITVPVSLDQRVRAFGSSAPKPMRHMPWLRSGQMYSFRTIGLAVLVSIILTAAVSSLWYRHVQPQQTIVCLTPLPEVEVNGYVVVASSPTKGIKQ
jgi:predicted anti-sigma-YlaC factor YlaD